jgi:hypothetical protein
MKNSLLLMMCLSFALVSKAQEKVAVDTAYSASLREVTVKARWKNDTERYKYNQMKFYVKSILPYLNAGTQLFKDINAKAEDPNVSRKERRKYINSKEEEMRTQFEDRVKALNVTQGVLLVKLLTRQTNLNIYKGLQEFKNPLVAIKWQTWAKLNGMNLNRKYNPEEEPDLENIMYELGYPLPQGYAAN